MHTILYLGSTTDLGYERDLLREWDKTCVRLATCLALPDAVPLERTGTDAAVALAPAPDPLSGVDAVVVESGELDADELRGHPQLAVVVILDDRRASADVAEATTQNTWVTRAQNRSMTRRLPFVPQGAPSHADRRHALQDALAGIAGERPSGRVNEL